MSEVVKQSTGVQGIADFSPVSAWRSRPDSEAPPLTALPAPPGLSEKVQQINST